MHQAVQVVLLIGGLFLAALVIQDHITLTQSQTQHQSSPVIYQTQHRNLLDQLSPPTHYNPLQEMTETRQQAQRLHDDYCDRHPVQCLYGQYGQ